jgi:hypothetical protein
MNELKPEDVMRALDILDKMDFFQGQRAGRELWFEKPFEVQEQDIADFSQGVAFVKNLITDALALLREKDAEIERLTKDFWGIQADINMRIADARAEAITEFSEKLKEAVKYIPWCDYHPVHNCIDEIEEKLKGETDGKSDL